MIKYTDFKKDFLEFDTIQKLKEYIVEKLHGLVVFENIILGEAPNKNNTWKNWRYIYIKIHSPWDGKLHKQIYGIVELGGNNER